MKKTLAILTVAIAVPAVLAGCAPQSAGAVPQADITIGVTPGADLAPLYLGVKEGFFADQGINLTINSLASSSAAVLSAVSDDKFDFGYADTVSILAAQEQGLAIELVSGAAATSGDVRNDYAAIIVRDSSGLNSVADLRYLNVSVDAKGTINDLVARTALQAAGADPASVNWHEIPFVDATEKLNVSRIDAALVVEPFVTEARLNGFRVISYPYAEFDPNLTVSGYVVSDELKSEDPELVERFLAALDTSLEHAEAEKYDVRTNIGTYISTSDSSVLSRLALPTFTREIDRDAAQKLSDAAVAFGLLTAAPNLDEVLP
jgi:NitT/TauT family transport system substrate-binding protein